MKVICIQLRERGQAFLHEKYPRERIMEMGNIKKNGIGINPLGERGQCMRG